MLQHNSVSFLYTPQCHRHHIKTSHVHLVILGNPQLATDVPILHPSPKKDAFFFPTHPFKTKFFFLKKMDFSMHSLDSHFAILKPISTLKQARPRNRYDRKCRNTVGYNPENLHGFSLSHQVPTTLRQDQLEFLSNAFLFLRTEKSF